MERHPGHRCGQGRRRGGGRPTTLYRLFASKDDLIGAYMQRASAAHPAHRHAVGHEVLGPLPPRRARRRTGGLGPDRAPGGGRRPPGPDRGRRVRLGPGLGAEGPARRARALAEILLPEA